MQQRHDLDHWHGQGPKLIEVGKKVRSVAGTLPAAPALLDHARQHEAQWRRKCAILFGALVSQEAGADDDPQQVEGSLTPVCAHLLCATV